MSDSFDLSMVIKGDASSAVSAATSTDTALNGLAKSQDAVAK